MTKKEIRKKYLADRQALTRAQISSASQKIHDWLFQSIAVHAYTNIHVFLPIKDKNEPDTWLIISTLQTDFKSKIIVPKMLPKGVLSHYLYNFKTNLMMNQWGVQEPEHDAALLVDEKTIDLVLIPLLAFDKKGYRVGYGKGYYDRFLAKCRPDVLKIGIAVFDPIESIDDLDEFDIKLDFCITPKRIWKF
jgi:5-formyltetrahydrofolate cyclo-ligase